MPLSGLCIRQMQRKCTQSIHRDNTQSNDKMQSRCKSDTNSQFVHEGFCGPHRGRSCAGQGHSQSSVTKTLLSFTKPYITTTCGAGQSHSQSVTQTLIFHETYITRTSTFCPFVPSLVCPSSSVYIIPLQGQTMHAWSCKVYHL